MGELAPGEREQIIADAQRARARYEPELRRLGATGELQIGADPAQPTWRQWWARCVVARTYGADTLGTPLMADGYGTPGDALAALVELAAAPRA